MRISFFMVLLCLQLNMAQAARPSIKASELFNSLNQSGEIHAVLNQIMTHLKQRVPNDKARLFLEQTLTQAVQSRNFQVLDRFPVIPLEKVGAFRNLLAQSRPLSSEFPDFPSFKAGQPLLIQGDLISLLGNCDSPRTFPQPIAPDLPDLRWGIFPDETLSDCQFDRSIKLAKILTTLAMHTGSVIHYNSAEISTPAQLIEQLIATGHQVLMRNERTYADLISMIVDGDKDLKWPLWVDTGVILSDGTALVIPMGHSQQAWVISGPLVNAKFAFYLGVDGVGFFPQTDVRPDWTGQVSSYEIQSIGTNTAKILKAFTVAESYLRRIRFEWNHFALGFPADGYGYLGVCNDSNALIELLTVGTVSTFPLIRAAELDEVPRSNTRTDIALRQLPHDADYRTSKQDRLRRILAMTPYPLNSPDMVDEELRSQLKLAERDLRDLSTVGSELDVGLAF